jgi:hypothetical protein
MDRIWGYAPNMQSKGNDMQNVLFALSLGLGGAAIAVDSARAQQATCADRGDVVERLQTKYGETRQSIGLGRNNGVVEVYASDETGTWTILLSRPDGMACLVAAGEYFESLNETLPELADEEA